MNKDRWPAEVWRSTAPDVRRMIEQHWRVLSTCNKCGLSMWTDLELIARDKGATAVLWNKHPRCKRIGCEGNVTFFGVPPGLGSTFRVRLVAEWPKGMEPPRYPPGQR